MAKSIPVSLFAENFRRVWLGAQKAVHPGHTIPRDGSVHLPRNIGLAVSGGADSMALAYLCRQLELSSQHSATDAPLSVTGFVVDHRAREESSREASTVAGWLSDLGIKTRILELDWSPFSAGDKSEQEPQPMPTAFETYARQLRFQALGKACHDHGIEALLMGHHRDDSIETTLWRLATGARRAGLGGIQEVARIPECHGIFGVSESGSSIRLSANQNDGSIRPRVRLNDKNEGRVAFVPETKDSPLRLTQSSIASGGVFLCRPLLAFPKTMLLETCHQNKIPYVSDPTNFDPTLTPRNAIRSMLASNSLPRALRPASILALIKSSKTFLQITTQFSDQLLGHRCRILDFNFKTGTMIIKFLQVPASSDPLLENNTAERIRQIQSLSLRRITELVSPFPGNHFSLRSFEPFVPRIFYPSHENHNGKEVLSRPFTLGGVIFHPLSKDPSSSSEESQCSQFEGESLWMFSRQPFMKNRSPVLRVDIPLPNLEQSPQIPSVGPWTLWDDRFWFRFSVTRLGVKNSSSRNRTHEPRSLPLVLRPFQKSDLETIRHGSARGAQDGARLLGRLKRALLDDAPGSTRFTIPLLGRGMSTEPGQGQDGEIAQILALPTLDIRLSDNTKSHNEMEITFDGQRWKLGWEWMYKMVDTEALRLMGGPI